MIILALCLVAAVVQGQGELSIEISPVVIPGTIGECPSDDIRQDSRSLLGNATREIIHQISSPLPECGPGNWRSVFSLDTSRPDQSCPDNWNLVTSPVRGCTGVGSSCSSTFSDDIVAAYSKVCGRIIGKGVATPDAFHPFTSNQNSIEGHYVDGVSITHGAPGLRAHIWTFAIGLTGHCPCDNGPHGVSYPPPAVGDNYFCGRAGVDRLWTGESCASDNPCCSFHNPPYFSVQLPSATTDRIELRICTDQHHGDENVLVLFAEIFVQ